METMEIVLLIAGVIIFILSFFIPDKSDKNTGMSKALAEEEIKKLVADEFASIKDHVDGVVEEAVTYAMEKTERSLERLSNEKIMAVSEYSDTVLAEIHKNHEEAMFLYDMLNNKHINLKDTVSEVNRTVKEAEEAVSGIKKMVPEAVAAAQVQETVEQNVAETGAPEVSKGFDGGVEATDRFGGLQETARKMSFIAETDEQGQNSNEKILELYKQGKSVVAIAKELGLGVGEVKLVIGLYKNQ